jgi:hypothetical protein
MGSRESENLSIFMIHPVLSVAVNAAGPESRFDVSGIPRNAVRTVIVERDRDRFRRETT